jgi:hypothetical protein
MGALRVCAISCVEGPGRIRRESLGRHAERSPIPGVIRHLENVERWWLREIFAGEPDLSFDWTDESRRRVPPSARRPDHALLAAYRGVAAVRRRDRAAVSLDQVSAARGYSLRWILIHLVQETARPSGSWTCSASSSTGGSGRNRTDRGAHVVRDRPGPDGDRARQPARSVASSQADHDHELRNMSFAASFTSPPVPPL